MGATGSKTPRASTKEGRQAGLKFDEVELHVISLTYKDLAGLSKGEKHGESIDKATFLQNFPVPGLVGDRLFHALDSNKSGRISYDDFVVGLAVCCRGTLEEKMRFIFGVYDMNGDGLISRDELLLMLNQVPRTLLNMGVDGNEKHASSGSSLGWNDATDGNTDVGGGRGEAPPARVVTPHSKVFNSSREGEVAPFSAASPARRPASMSGFGANSMERRGSREGAAMGLGGRGSMSAFTNESIADQALNEFGSGEGQPLNFDQFQSWAQQTPAVQALLQGAFPSDAHFSLATSPTARRVSCESLAPYGSPRRGPTPTHVFGTPVPSRESEAAATAVAAVAAWSASASATRSSISARGTPMRQRHSFGGESRVSASGGEGGVNGGGSGGGGVERGHNSVGRSFFSGIDPPPMSARTPSRTLSRNTSYDNLLRSPLVGQGVGSAAGTLVSRGVGSRHTTTSPTHRRPGRGGSFSEFGCSDVGAGAGMPSTLQSGKQVWRWGPQPGAEQQTKTPRVPLAGAGAREWDKDRDEGITSALTGAEAVAPHSSSKGAALPKNRERERGAGGGGGNSLSPSQVPQAPQQSAPAPPAPPPITTVRMRRKTPSSGASPLHRGPSSPRSASSGGAGGGRGFHRRDSSGGGLSVSNSEESVPSGPSSRPSSMAFSLSVGGGGGGGGGGGDSGAPPRTPLKPPLEHRHSPPNSTDVTRKARKLAMMAEAAEIGAKLPCGAAAASCQDLLALANAAAAGAKPPAVPPRRGKLLRYLSQDGGGGGNGGNAALWGTSTPGRGRFSRLVSLDGGGADGGVFGSFGGGGGGSSFGGGASRVRDRLSLRRANSLSAAGHRRSNSRGSSSGEIEAIAARMHRRSHDSGAVPPVHEKGGVNGNVAVNPGLGLDSRDDVVAAPGAPAVPVPPPAPAAPASPRVRARSRDRSRSRAPGAPTEGEAEMDYSSDAGNTAAVSVGIEHIFAAVSSNEKAPDPIVVPSAEVNLGPPLAKVSPLLAASGAGGSVDGGGEGRGSGSYPFYGGVEEAAEAESTAAGPEAVVRDCLYNSHGMVALDGYLWKPGSIRLVRRWMMLVDNTLYYFVRPGDRKPRGVISLPGCIAEAVLGEESSDGGEEGSSKKEPRRARVPNGYFGLRLFRPNNHGRDASPRLLLAKSAQERDEWVAELRVASRVVPLEDIFELKALLRKGAFASVHRCVRKDTKEEYAVKVIDKTSLSSHEKFLLRGEIGALKLVSHPNVVRLEAVHEDPRSISIVMTLCRGGDLWDKVRAQPSRCFNADQARTVMRPLCEAVAYLHTLGILHRDIKPENILLVDGGDLEGVTLSDFGFSHQVSPKSRLACGKQLMGTPSYMAPESILHGMYGKEVDWFSCGCVLYMMLMGRAPFAGNSPSEIFRNTCHGRLGLGRGGASLWDKLPSAARELIVGLMQLDHNLRYTGEQAMNHRWLAQPEEGEGGGGMT